MSASTEAFGGTGLVLAVAFLSELAMLAALAFLGNAIGNGRAASVALAVALPLLAAVVWGIFLAPQSVVDLDPAVQIGGKGVLLAGTAIGLVAIGHVWIGVGLGVVGVGSTIAAFLVTAVP